MSNSRIDMNSAKIENARYAYDEDQGMFPELHFEVVAGGKRYKAFVSSGSLYTGGGSEVLFVQLFSREVETDWEELLEAPVHKASDDRDYELKGHTNDKVVLAMAKEFERVCTENEGKDFKVGGVDVPSL